MGIGSALHEESVLDHNLGRFMNHNLGEYHVPAHADISDIDVIFVDEPDDKASPIGVKGLGEIGIVGTGAAVANAIYHATGKRVRDLPDHHRQAARRVDATADRRHPRSRHGRPCAGHPRGAAQHRCRED